MPGPIVVDPTPSWLKPENASVTDSALTKALRMIGSLIGADNPTAQVMGLMMTEIPGGPPGGLAKAVTKLKERAIKAYHGSPHDFEKFNLEKIGTGEGAQAYGHGLYFAENPATALDYRNRLTGATSDITEVLHRGQPMRLDTPEAHAAKLLGDSGADLRELRSWARRTAKEAATGTDLGMNDIGQQAGMTGAEYYQRLSDFMQNTTKRDVAVKRGRMYEVAIHADPDDFLDWDKPLSQQPRVMEFLKSSDRTSFGKNSPGWRGAPEGLWEKAMNQHTGEELYGELRMQAEPQYRDAASWEASKVKASEPLKSAGIPGIKYLDQGSRAAGEGSRNYVVFDDRLIDILKKYGVLMPASGARRFLSSPDEQ